MSWSSLRSYPGGKNNPGTLSWIINQIPPVTGRLVEAFAGSAAILRTIRPAPKSCLIDVDRDVIRAHRRGAFGQLPENTAILCREAVDWIAGRQWKRADLIYLDPPYLPETLAGRQRYRHGFDTADHKRLLALVGKLPCRVILSGYQSHLYATRLADWRTLTRRVTTRGGPAVECLWLNFARAEELHDYRWLGDDRRQRERIHRVQRRLIARLQKLPALERNALLAAIKESNP